MTGKEMYRVTEVMEILSLKRSVIYEQLRSGRLRSNILITISGVQSPVALVQAVLAVGADAIMFAVDYPYE